MLDPLECWKIIEFYDAHKVTKSDIRLAYTIGGLRAAVSGQSYILLASNRFEPDSFTVFDYRKYPYVEQKFNDLLTAQAFARMRV